MIAYLPELYEDELAYSWFARYFVHMYPVYASALEDLLENRNMRPDVEFVNRLSVDARAAITKVIPMEKLVLGHTMFPCYRFIENERLRHALKAMACHGGDAHRLLPVPKRKDGNRCIRYCPLCAAKAREIYGEAYWTRTANIRDVDVCARHGCRLKDTGIEISAKQSLRLYAAEDEIKDAAPEFVNDGLELQFARYLTDLFQRPVCMGNTAEIGGFLNSRLENTRYLSIRGGMRNVSLLFQEFMEFYRELPGRGITELSQMQKIFTGYRWDFYEVCQIAFFLEVSTDELADPRLPEKSQTEIFNGKVRQLYAQGLGCYRIAQELGCSPSTVKNANKIKQPAEHDYSGRKGKYKEDWEKMDEELLPAVMDACEQIYHNYGGRPGRVTVYAVCRQLELPGKRFGCLPKCREAISGYEEKNITMADLITKVIKENQLAPAEEDAVLAMLGERKQERDEKRICRCLAEYAQKELDLMLAVRNRLDCEKCRRVTKLCFKESRIGSMDIEDFSKADIRKLIILTAENRRLDNEDRLAFLFTLQGALNQMDREGVLGFRPPENIADAYMAAMDRITYIDRPYTLEEVQKITEWIDRNRQDMAALAAGLWLEADITAEEVTELKKEDLMDADGACIKNPSVLKKNAAEDYIAVAGRRARIIQNALALHGEENLEYIFMDKGREGWKKMSRKRLPQKMSWICREIGIAYQPVKCTDAIKPCEG